MDSAFQAGVSPLGPAVARLRLAQSEQRPQRSLPHRYVTDRLRCPQAREDGPRTASLAAVAEILTDLPHPLVRPPEGVVAVMLGVIAPLNTAKATDIAGKTELRLPFGHRCDRNHRFNVRERHCTCRATHSVDYPCRPATRSTGKPGGGGGGRESNPPQVFQPATGFEDQGAHQALVRLRGPGYFRGQG